MSFAVQFCEAIRAAGISPPDAIEADGKLHRFASNGKRGDDSGWYVLYGDGIPSGRFGDWRSDLSQSWHADIGRKLTPADIIAHRARVAKMKHEREGEETRRRAEAAAKAAALWKAAQPAGGNHPYLIRKAVAPVESLRELGADEAASILGYAPKAGGEPLTGRLLMAPVKVGGALSTVEMIDETGRKSAIHGGAKGGGHWAAQPLPNGNGDGATLLIGEGVATVMSAREGTGHPVVAALSSGNLGAVARVMRDRYPAAAIVILADLLKATGAPDPHAIEAARAVGGLLAVPEFGAVRPEGATDFNDLGLHRGREAVEHAIRDAKAPGIAVDPPATANATAGDSDAWPAPLPLGAKVAPKPYPVDALPATIRAAIEEVQGFTKAPMALVASSALAALSVTIQAYVDVRRADRLQGPVGLFLLTIADSGERKSTCDGFFTAAIRDYQAQQAETAKPKLATYRADFDAWKAKRDALTDAIRSDTKGKKPTGRLEQELRELESAKPEPLRVPQLLRGDETPEALAFALAREWPSAGVISAEAGSILGAHGMGRDSIMRNLSLLNILWDGGTLQIGRRTTESFAVRGARLTMALQVQEATLRAFFDRSDGLARGTGFLARYLVAWPESTQGHRPFTEAPASWPALAAFNRRLAALLEQAAPIGDDGALSPALMTLSPDAKARWTAFHDAIEGELAAGGELYDVRDVASKTADNAARLAALFQAFEHGAGAVVADCFDGASRIAAWHLNEARRSFGELALPTEPANAARLDAWLLDYCRRERTSWVPRRAVQQFGPGGVAGPRGDRCCRPRT